MTMTEPKNLTVAEMKEILQASIKMSGLPLVIRKIDLDEKFASLQVIVQHGAERKHLRNLQAAYELSEMVEEVTGWQVFATEHNSAK